MKHRTVTGFIVVLATLAVMPQAVQQLTLLRNAAGERLNDGIWGVFLSLNGQKVESGARVQTLPTAADPACPAVFDEVASRGTRAARVDARAAKAGEGLARAKSDVIEVKNFAFEFDGHELAALTHPDESKALKIVEDGRWIVRAPEAPVKVLPPLPAAHEMKYFKGQPYVHGVGEMLKGLEIYRGQQGRRLQKVNVVRAESQRTAALAVRAEAVREAEREWKTEAPCPTRDSLLNCNGVEEELMN